MKLPPHTIVFHTRAKRIFIGHTLEIREAGPGKQRVEILALVNNDTVAIVEPQDIELVQLASEEGHEHTEPLFARLLQANQV